MIKDLAKDSNFACKVSAVNLVSSIYKKADDE